MLLAFFTIVKIHAIQQVIQQGMKISFVLIIFLFLLSRAFRSLWNAGLLMGVVFLISSVKGILVGNITEKVFLDGILNSFVLFTTYSFVKYISKQGLLKRVLDDFLYIDIFSCIISVFSMLAKGRASSVTGTATEYFFGNKFSSTYILMFLIGLLYIKFYDERKKKLEHGTAILFCILIEMFMSYWTRCSTTLIGGAVLLLTIMFSGKRTEWIRKFISNPIAAVIYLTLPGALALNMVAIMRIPQINQFVTGVLGKSSGLTGRTYIYSRLVEIFNGSPIWGYGYNSDMVNRLTGVGNAQNGLFQMLIEFGIVGVIVVCILIYKAFSTAKNIQFMWGLKVFVFTMCVCSVVEISFNYLFYMAIFVIGYSSYFDTVRSKSFANTIKRNRILSMKRAR